MYYIALERYISLNLCITENNAEWNLKEKYMDQQLTNENRGERNLSKNTSHKETPHSKITRTYLFIRLTSNQYHRPR